MLPVKHLEAQRRQNVARGKRLPIKKGRNGFKFPPQERKPKFGTALQPCESIVADMPCTAVLLPRATWTIEKPRLHRAGVSNELWHLIDDFISQLSDAWDVEDGIGQGAVLSGFLFQNFD